MKQVFNWTIGSFFRTIGRTIAFLVMGGIIYYILSSNGFEFGLKELFFDSVKADTHVSSWFVDYYKDSNKTQPYSTTNYYALQEITANTTNVSNIYFYFSQNITKRTKDENYLLIPIMVINERFSVIPLSNSQYACSYQFDSSTNSYYPLTCGYSTNSGYQNIPVDSNLKFVVKLYSINKSNALCTIEGQYAKCNLMDDAIYTAVKIEYNLPMSNQGSSMYFGVNQGIYAYKDSLVSIYEQQSETTNAITNQTQQQQQQHEEVMDSNTTEAEEEASSFFEDFDAPDIGGLGAIITAPLNTIRSLLNSSCTNLVLPLPYVDEDLTLPCMNTIYTQHFGAFFTIYQTIVLALIAYRCIRSIFFDIHGFTNPNDDRIEVMDL